MSDGSGKYYTLSIEDVLRGIDLIDFEKLNSLEGVFLANKYEEKGIAGEPKRIYKTVGNKTFWKLDVEADTIAKSRMS